MVITDYILSVDPDKLKKICNNNQFYYPNLSALQCSHPKKIDRFFVVNVDKAFKERFPVLVKIVGIKEVKPITNFFQCPANADLFYFLDANRAKIAAKNELVACIRKKYPQLDKNVVKIIGDYVIGITDWPSPERLKIVNCYNLNAEKSRLVEEKECLKIEIATYSLVKRQLESIETGMENTTKKVKMLEKLINVLEN